MLQRTLRLFASTITGITMSFASACILILVSSSFHEGSQAFVFNSDLILLAVFIIYTAGIMGIIQGGCIGIVLSFVQPHILKFQLVALIPSIYLGFACGSCITSSATLLFIGLNIIGNSATAFMIYLITRSL